MGKRIVAVLAATLVLLLAAPGAQASPGAARPEPEAYCGITWGSQLRRSGPPNSPGSPLTDVRTGRHDCYDRMVLHLDGPTAGYRVRYVDEVFTVASGEVISLRAAGAALEIVLKAPADDGAGHPTYDGVSPRRLPRSFRVPGLAPGAVQTRRLPFSTRPLSRAAATRYAPYARG